MNVFSSSSRVLKSASNGNPKLFNKVFMGINPYRGGGGTALLLSGCINVSTVVAADKVTTAKRGLGCGRLLLLRCSVV